MSKLTKRQIKTHERASSLVTKPDLTHEEILFILENYREDAVHINSKTGAFLTPFDLAWELSHHIPFAYQKKIKILDMCAGIGTLSYAASLHGDGFSKCYSDITCIEINNDYVNIGKSILPNATWICGDALDPALLSSLGQFDCVIANLPFGNVQTQFKAAYKGGAFEYMIIEAASKIAKRGAFIIPQGSAPFIFSGENVNRLWLDDSCRARRFEEKTGIKLEFGIGVDTAMYKDLWHGVSPVCEIVCCEFNT